MRGSAERGAQRPGHSADVEIDIGPVSLPGTMVLPEDARALVVFAHGSGSSRLSPRNNLVASILHQSGFGTLLFDLLTAEEDENYDNRFDIDLLALRLAGATDWLLRRRGTGLKVAYFGASTGAAAALQASVGRPEIKAIVSRGGRPDLAWGYLDKVAAPTLLIVGGMDEEVLELNRRALDRLKVADKQLVVVPGATHLFEEPGTLEEAAKAAGSWFLRFAR
jgi:putative phosphoribosyl transferase